MSALIARRVAVVAFAAVALAAAACTPMPPPATSPAPVVGVVAGAGHTCVAVGADLQVRCFGANASGQLGRGSTNTVPNPDAAVVTDATGGPVRGVPGSGAAHSCATLDSPTSPSSTWSVRCWGSNVGGQLGVDPGTTPADPSARTLASASFGIPAQQVSGGDRHTCFRLTRLAELPPTDGVRCVGSNQFGQLAIVTNFGTATPVTSPAEDALIAAPILGVIPIRGVLDLDAGGNHTCVVSSMFESPGATAGRVICWGDNFYGQLGVATGVGTSNPVDPQIVPGITDAVRVDTGRNHTCAVLATGAAKCWGWNLYGQLGAGFRNAPSGPGGTTFSALPPQDVLISGAVDVAVGDEHSCALLGDRSVRCWGNGSAGQLGRTDIAGSPGTPGLSLTPVAPEGLPPALASPRPLADLRLDVLAAGALHTCVVGDDQRLRCFGFNQFGATGQPVGSPPATFAPAVVSLPA